MDKEDDIESRYYNKLNGELSKHLIHKNEE